MKRKLKKQDITKTTITVGLKKKALDTQEITSSKFTINLQKWIKMSPDQQQDYATANINANIEELIDYNVIQ